MMGDYYILVIEPDSTIQTLCVNALQQHDYGVSAAATAEEVRQALSAQRFDAVLCNTRVDRDSGMHLLREYYVQLVKQETLVVLMSDHAGMRSVCDELGFDFFHCNPLCLTRLVNFLNWSLRDSFAVAGD